MGYPEVCGEWGAHCEYEKLDYATNAELGETFRSISDDNGEDSGVPAMNEHGGKPPVSVEVDRALREHAPILLNLLELYAHDFSQFHKLDIGADGRFGYASLPLYWSEPHRHPFLIRVDGKLAGLAFVKRGSEISGNETAWDMAEFFVLRGYRRRGVGMLAAKEVWSRFPGIWEVRVMQSNGLAKMFWEQAVSNFTGEAIQPACVEKDGRHWQFFSFESKGGISHTCVK